MKSRSGFWLVQLLGSALIILSCISQPAQVNRTPLSHARLFFSAGDVATLRDRAATTHAAIWLPIKGYVDTLLATSPPSSAPTAGDLDAYRTSGDQLIPLAFACVVTDEAPYCDLARRYLLTYAQWTQWGENQERGLGHAHMLLGNALAYDWLYPRLTSAEQQSVRKSLAHWASQLYEASIGPKDAAWNNWWFNSYIQNHYVINNSALGVAALVLLGEDDRAQQWLDHAVAQLAHTQYLLEGIQDGSWHEGLSYQAYMLAMALPFWINLRTQQGIDLFPHTYLRQYITWRLYNDLPNTEQYLLAYGNFEWSFLNSRSQHLVRFAASEYKNDNAEWLFQQFLRENQRQANIWSTPWYVFEFFYYDPTIPPQPPTTLPLAHAFPDAEGVIWRSGWGANDLVFGLKTGPYGGRFAFDTFVDASAPWDSGCGDSSCRFNFGHDHDDANTFYLFGRGQWLAPEKVGYDDSDTVFHNTILIDGQGQFRPQPDSLADPAGLAQTDGFLKATANTVNFAYLAADATRRYQQIGDIQEVARTVVFVRPDYFVMLDNLRADQAHQYEWTNHFGESVAIDGKWVRGNAPNNQVLGVAVAAPQPFAVLTGKHGAIPYVRIRPADNGKDVRFAHILYPTDGGGWATKPTISTLADTPQATVIRVQMQDGSDWVDEIILARTQPGLPVAAGPYDFDGQVAVVRRGSNGALAKLFVYGATFLKDRTTGHVFVTGLDPTQASESSGGGCEGLPQEAEHSDQGIGLRCQ